ncbi:MAG: hypothetical protein ACI85Q_002880 [Salibacteraceae bacterium]|jgi:hypothetical protein
MKNTVNFSLLLFYISSTLLLGSCKKENLDVNETKVTGVEQTEPAKIVGTWEMYKVEKQELRLDSLTLNPPQSFTSMVWYDQTSSMANEQTIDFNDDLTFDSFYAGVPISAGTWDALNDSTFTLSFSSTGSGEWSDITTDYIVTVYCDNTMSVAYLIAPPVGNHEHQGADWHYVAYFRAPGSVECDGLIDYYVQ